VISPDRVAAVVVSSHAPGSRVPGAARVLQLDGWRGPHSVSRRCSCNGASFHCEGNDDLGDAAARLLALTGKRLAGYAMRYSADRLAVRPYDAAVAARLAAGRGSEDAARQQCQAKANPDFDRMFE
jgi:hypothetical protein